MALFETILFRMLPCGHLYLLADMLNFGNLHLRLIENFRLRAFYTFCGLRFNFARPTSVWLGWRWAFGPGVGGSSIANVFSWSMRVELGNKVSALLC